MQIMTTWKKEKTMDIREDEIVIKRERFEALVMNEIRLTMIHKQFSTGLYIDNLSVAQLKTLLPCQSAATEIAIKQRIKELE